MGSPLKWHGGKAYLAKWIISHFPPRDNYTHYNEAFAGGLSVLFAHDPEGKSETVNDLNEHLTNFWRVLSRPSAFEQFSRMVQATPLSEWVFDNRDAESGSLYWKDFGPDATRAWEFFIKYRQSRQGLGKDYCTPTTRTRRGMNENVSAWLASIDGLPDAHSRLRRVEIRTKDAVDFIQQYDHDKALFYLDPPYTHDTRVTKDGYEREMSRDDHHRLLVCLSKIRGMFCISGYANDLYQEFADANGWRVASIEIDNKASSRKSKPKKVECLWMNYGG